MPFTLPPQQPLTREAFASIAREQRRTRDDDLDRALTMLDGIDPSTNRTDAELLADELVKRYGIGIQKLPNGNYHVYKRGQFADMLDLGAVEKLCLRTYRRIVESTATLFSQVDQAWTIYTGESEEPDVEAQETLATIRDSGSFDVAVIRADEVAVSLGSCLVRSLWRGGRLVYESIPPQCVYLGYGRMLFDGDESRAVVTSDIEDASIVAIRLPAVADEKRPDQRDHFVAYMARSEKMPNGRCVEYLAREWYQVPEPGTDGILYEHPEGNPLTLLQNRTSYEECPHEYPVTVLYGSSHPQSEAMPLHGMSLYAACMEIDLAASRLLKCALDAAGKTAVLTQTESSLNEPPSSITGAVLLQPNETLTWEGPPAGDVKESSDVLVRLMKTIAEAWHVPGYQVVDDDWGGSTHDQSGVALAIRTQPMITHRQMRERINRASVMRLFAIERCVIEAATGQRPWPSDARLVWYPGRVITPRNEKELLEQLKLGLEIGVIDIVYAVQEYHQIPTVEDARIEAEAIAQRSKEVPIARGKPVGRDRPGAPVPGAAAALDDKAKEE